MNSGECHQPKFQLVSKLTDLVMAFFLNLPQGFNNANCFTLRCNVYFELRKSLKALL